MNKYLIIIILAFNSVLIYSQSVEALVKMAIAHNLGLESLRLDYAAAQERANQVTDYPDPTVNIGIGVLPIETRLGAQRFRIGVSQPIVWKGLLDARKETQLSMASSLSFMDELKEIDIAYAVRSAYNVLLFIEDRLSIIKERLQILDLLEEIAKSSVRSGKGKLSNVLMIQRTREGLEADLKLIQKQSEEPTILINRWTGRALEEPIVIVVDEPSFLDNVLLQDFAENQHPTFQIINSQITASEKSMELTFLEAKPKIGVGLEYAWIDARNDVMNLAGNGRDVIMPMGSVTIPIHTDRYKSKRQEERVKQLSLDALKVEKKEAFLAEIAAAKSKMEYANLEIQKLVGLKNITTETIDLLRSEYAAEGTRFEELLRLEMELIDYDLMIAKAKYDHLTSTTILLKFQSLE